MSRTISSLLLLLAAALLFACKDDGGGSTGGAGGAGFGGFGAISGAGAGAGAGGAGAGGAGAGGAGAGGAGAGGAGMGGSGSMATFAPTFSAIYQEIIVTTGCNGGPTCHTGPVAGNLMMNTKDEAYTSMVGVAAMGTTLVGDGPDCKDSGMMRVVAGQPDASLLVKKIESSMAMPPPCGSPMPLNPPMLTPMQIAQVRMWIQMGAMNN
jgi:hypothetical protein